tara:strand:- start:174 stop:425 length:252 start_codon:yes stop_codon:yes gene_type:complete
MSYLKDQQWRKHPRLIPLQAYSDAAPLGRERLVTLLCEKFSTVDLEKARQDILPFVKTEKEADINDWSLELFTASAQDIAVNE